MSLVKRIFDNIHIKTDNPLINQWDWIVLNFNKTLEQAIESKNESYLYNFLNTKNNNATCEYGYDNNDSMTHDGTDMKPSYMLLINYLLIQNNIDIRITQDNFDSEINTILSKLDEILGFEIDFKTFTYETKLYESNKGNVTPRKLMSIIYLHFIKKSLNTIKDKSILEIGGGNGFVAYLSYLAGVKEYIIIDIPTTQTIQFWNLCNLVGPENVSFISENKNTIIKLGDTESYKTFYNRNFDLVCNFDGITEYGIPTAYNYFENFDKISKKMLSINHLDNFLYNGNVYNEIPYTFKNFYLHDIDWLIYTNKYTDLKIALKTKNDSINHYNNHGIFENRTPSLTLPKKYNLIFNDYSNKEDTEYKWRTDHSYTIELIEFIS